MAARLCPSCRVGNLRRHCPKTNTTCSWTKCPACKVTFDLAAGRGFDDDGMPVRWAA